MTHITIEDFDASPYEYDWSARDYLGFDRDNPNRGSLNVNGPRTWIKLSNALTGSGFPAWLAVRHLDEARQGRGEGTDTGILHHGHLYALGACDGWREAFERHFPKGLEVERLADRNFWAYLFGDHSGNGPSFANVAGWLVYHIWEELDPADGGREWELIRYYAPDLRGDIHPDVDFRSASLYAANGEGADLRGRVMSGAAFQYANLCGADLRGANVQGVSFGRADLSGADLRGVTGFEANTVFTDAILEGTLISPDLHEYLSMLIGGGLLLGQPIVVGWD